VERVIVGLSGGVDSAVTAALLQQRGYEVRGVTLKLWKMEQPSDAQNSAGNVASALGIPLTELDLMDRFYQNIVQSFVDGYASGVTPNPCVICNPTLKFHALLEVANAFNARWIATGHYARVIHHTNQSCLLRGSARNKDQSYALYRLGQTHLSRIQFPLGEFTSKTEVRGLAREWGIPSAEKADSQDLCFMGGGDYRTLLKAVQPISNQPGHIVDEQDRVLGEHQGLAFFTIGQRSGLGISSSHRLYVIKLDPRKNVVIVGPRSSLDRSQCQLEAVTFTSDSIPDSPFFCMGRYRYRSPEVPIKVTLLNENKANVQFDKPQQMIAPGQSLVFYEGDEVLGGGIITRDDINTA
jgi:tRNA-specific 2-thiouridylase